MPIRKIALAQYSFFMEQLVGCKFIYHQILVEPEPFDSAAYRLIANKIWDQDAKLDESKYRFFLGLLWDNKFPELEAELDKLN